VDVIYIDPPYNTGARDWKYNNRYVDTNDQYRHSKWLAMMKRRLRLARRLLKPDTGVLIVTIDEHEVNHLGMLLEKELDNAVRQMVTIVINQKGIAQGRLSRAEEYAFFCFMNRAFVGSHYDDLLSPERPDTKRFEAPRWERLLRGGTNSRREDRPGLFFPIFVDPSIPAIVKVGDPIPLGRSLKDVERLLPMSKTGSVDTERTIAWPIRKNGALGNWRVSPPTLRRLIAKGYVKLGGYDEKRKTWTVLYLGKRAQQQIESGVIKIVDRNPDTNAVNIEYAEAQERQIKTVWHRGVHDAGNYGSSLLRSILGEGALFSFPKSLYAVSDALGTVVRERPDALILDFFAGSGTTLHATCFLNSVDSGQRRTILVTNNEVEEKLSSQLNARGLCAGDSEFEKHGICEAVAWPRCKYVINGHREDGTDLP
jgi:adenine-specific DNA-methyltransferase